MYILNNNSNNRAASKVCEMLGEIMMLVKVVES